MIMTFPLDLPPHMSEIGLRLCCIMLCYYEQCVHGSTNFLYTEHRHPTYWISFEFRPLLDLLRLAIYISNLSNLTYIHIHVYIHGGHTVAQLVEALRFKPEGRGFDSRYCHWIFSLT